MGSVHYLEKQLETTEAGEPSETTAFDGGGSGGDNGGMEARVTKLESFAQDVRDRLVRVEANLEHTATKADLSDAVSTVAKWTVGTALALGVAATTVMTFAVNNAKSQSAASPPAPIVINIPPPQAPAPK